ncbi:MAG: hypothetical protein WCK55_01160 [Verrucomicrobiota bacterium]
MSKKLPAIRFVPRPDWQKKRLAEWLEEWNLEQKLRGDTESETPSQDRHFPVIGAVVGLMNTPALLRTADFAADIVRRLSSAKAPSPPAVSPDGEAMRKLVREFDRPVAVGQVRLLSPELTPDSDRPVFIAVFGEWDEAEVLIAPFSPFSVPATTGEWLTGRTTPVLQVLEVWNARSVPNAALEESWRVDAFTDAECKGAWHVFEHDAFGKALDPEFEQQVGPPLVHPEDPRRRYQDEEVALLAKFQASAQSMQGRRFDEDDSAPAAAAAPELQEAFETGEDLALAASEKELLPEIVRVDDLLAGFQGEATGDGCAPSKASRLRLTFTGPESPRPMEVPAGGVIIVWPTGQTEPSSFTHRSGRWRTEIRLSLPWPEMVSLLREKKIRSETVPPA